MITYQVVPTPVGPLTMLAHDGPLVAAGFTADPRELFVRLPQRLQELPLVAGDLAEAAEAVRAYVDGELDALDRVPVAEQAGTPTRRRLYAALRAVPAGATVTYGQLAEKAGLPRTAARAAGTACAQNLIAPFVPCHRVLPATGGYGGYYYGSHIKQWLLTHERR
ncbi:methylated-DNA--[protein]-cysteine S-methyltransferase [Thermobispora bispora]|uniref:methylated-DNA--[protein]-cysteine S-methyltransferase n=1 Tax=Thermobispora bispora TaxID=2006 RepID=UPI00197CDBA9|nr:methylated-DNA--[protein]-cysteine S-methyltransferase [Thermobispora bispora]QSI47362.1 methylated-DNA--[protein]-cysteine S-methyltransferase [Thermobispora bispora]